MANFTSSFTRLLLNMYDALGSWWVRYKSCMGVPDYISWKVLQMSYCSTASPQPAVSQAGKPTWECSVAERRGFWCLFPVLWSWLFSCRAQQSCPHLHWLLFLLELFFCHFNLLSQQKTILFAEKDCCKGANFLPSEVSCRMSSLWPWNCGLCHTAPRPQVDCGDCSFSLNHPRTSWQKESSWCSFVSQWVLLSVKLWKVEEEKSLAAFLNADWPCL